MSTLAIFDRLIDILSPHRNVHITITRISSREFFRMLERIKR